MPSCDVHPPSLWPLVWYCWSACSHAVDGYLKQVFVINHLPSGHQSKDGAVLQRLRDDRQAPCVTIAWGNWGLWVRAFLCISYLEYRGCVSQGNACLKNGDSCGRLSHDQELTFPMFSGWDRVDQAHFTLETEDFRPPIQPLCTQLPTSQPPSHMVLLPATLEGGTI